MIRSAGRTCLNPFIDIAYALAKARGAALLYKGDGFARTDIAAA
jgi:uncharacterized protein with PIN domain